jgi:CRP/FNR family transcriptional regulator, anaerobic regulatory protein
MIVRAHSVVELGPHRITAACQTCAACEFSMCQIVSKAVEGTPSQLPALLQHAVPARRIISREQELQDMVPFICEGWAACVAILEDGSRQILSFLLPGDIVSTALLFDTRPHYAVEAITDVRYRNFERGKLREVLSRNADVFERFAAAWIEEKTRADRLIIDLGRRTADERISRLILGLAERLARRGMMDANSMEMEFPLRQHHIADASGLTPVHVSKVLSEFRRNGLISIGDRSLTILDPAGFRRVAHMR